jgi:4-carboxymuconolactone decarboxylase
MSNSELHEKGLAMRKALRNDEDFEKNAAEYAASPAKQGFIDIVTETVFGALWTRPGLDVKTRAIICVVSDTATGRYPELEIHLKFALRQGWTEEELTETLYHLLGYVGAPLVRDAIFVADKVFAEERARKA